MGFWGFGVLGFWGTRGKEVGKWKEDRWLGDEGERDR